MGVELERTTIRQPTSKKLIQKSICHLSLVYHGNNFILRHNVTTVKKNIDNGRPCSSFTVHLLLSSAALRILLNFELLQRFLDLRTYQGNDGW